MEGPVADWKRASEMLDRFEREEKLHPADAEELVAKVFRACGHPVADTGFVESDRGVDMFVETKVGGAPHRISRPASSRAAAPTSPPSRRKPDKLPRRGL